MTKVYLVESGVCGTSYDWDNNEFPVDSCTVEGIFDSLEKAIDCMIYESSKQIEEYLQKDDKLFIRPLKPNLLVEGKCISYAITKDDCHGDEIRDYWMRYKSYDLL